MVTQTGIQNFLLAIIEHFSLGVTAEVLRANINGKSDRQTYRQILIARPCECISSRMVTHLLKLYRFMVRPRARVKLGKQTFYIKVVLAIQNVQGNVT